MQNRLLKILRVTVSLFFLIFTGFLFIDFTETLSSSFINGITWIQFVPSLIKFLNLVSFATLGFLLVVGITLLFGRVYCSTVCPLGILQDVFSYISKFYTKRIRKKRIRYRPSEPHNILRYSLLGVTTVFFLFGSVFLLNLLDPFSLFGKIFSGLVRPVYYGLNNMSASVLHSFGIYTLYDVGTRQMTVIPLIFPTLMLVLVAWLSLTRGRLYCNTVCPLGSLLGLISKISMYRIEIDDQLCNHCAMCSLNCKAECIDLKNNEIDFSRCVGCFNCLDVCSMQGINYRNKWFPGREKSKPEKQAFFMADPESDNISESGTEKEIVESKNHFTSLDTVYSGLSKVLEEGGRLTALNHNTRADGRDRREFLYHITAYFAGFSLLSTAGKAYGGQQEADRADLDVEITESSTVPEEKNYPISPPGSLSLEHYTEACTACQLCVSACPTHVLQPSFLEYGFTGMMQPRMDFHASFCNFDCIKCTEVCPTGAILPLTREEKHLAQVGVVRLELDNCVVQTENTACGACAEHCPTQAVRMVPYQDGLTIPEIHPEYCIGCGACEYICPTRPYRAIYIDGNQVHVEATPPIIEELDYEEAEEDFPF